MLKYLSILFLVSTQVLLAQDKKATVLISGRITNFITNSNIGNAKIEVFKNGSLLESKSTSSNGKYKLSPLEVDNNYKVVISSPGLVTRFFELELNNIPDEEKFGDGWDIPTDIPLVDRIPDVDFSSLEPKRTSVIKFRKSENKLDWDFNEITSYRNELKKLLEKAEKKKENKTNPETPVVTENPKLIDDADNALALNDYDNAIKLYNQAIASNPSKKNEILTKLEETKRAQKKFLLEEQLQREYDQFMQRGNEELNIKQYDKAIEFYRLALVRKPNDQLANDKIKEANNLKNSAIKTETVITNANTVTNSNTSTNTNSSNTTNSNTNTNNQVLVKNEEKKNEVNVIAKTETNSTTNTKGNNTNVSNNNNVINEHKPVVAKKDTSIINTKSSINNNNKVTNNTNNLSNTSNKTNNTNSTSKNTVNANNTVINTKSNTNNAASNNTVTKNNVVNTNSNSKNDEYKRAIENGNVELSAGNFEKSISFFNQALKYKNNDSYALKQLQRARTLRDEDIADKQQMYKQIINKAKELFNDKNYTEAKSLYERASGFNKNDVYPKNKIAECIKLLKPVEPVVKVEEIKTKTPQDPNYSETEAKELMQLTQRRIEENKYDAILKEKSELTSFYSTKAAEDLNRSYVDQELLNYNLYNRTNFYKSKDEYRLTKVNSTQVFINELNDEYQRKNRSYAVASYNNQQYINQNRFNLNSIITGKDSYRQKSIARLNGFVDNELNFIRNRKNYNLENANSNNSLFNKHIENGSAFSRNASGNYLNNANYYKTLNDNINDKTTEFKKEGSEQTNNNNLNFKNRTAPIITSYTNDELQKLVSDFGEGVHQWTEKKTNPEMIVYETKIRRIVVKNGQANDYTMIQNRWGTTFTKNGKSIVEHTWQIETAGKVKEYNPE